MKIGEETSRRIRGFYPEDSVLFRRDTTFGSTDGSLLILKSLANVLKSTFFLSTHIAIMAEKVKDLKQQAVPAFNRKTNMPTTKIGLNENKKSY
jgi:hypothetical protein